jgi:hypothetical protein
MLRLFFSNPHPSQGQEYRNIENLFVIQFGNVGHQSEARRDNVEFVIAFERLFEMRYMKIQIGFSENDFFFKKKRGCKFSTLFTALLSIRKLGLIRDSAYSGFKMEYISVGKLFRG